MLDMGSSLVGKRGKALLSLCMIVRNEGAFIRKCLESVRDVVDEMIVVDTGSNDDTIEICRSFGACVLTYPWNDDFAMARNHGLKHTTGDWILLLDADEEVDAKDAVQLRKAVCSEKADYYAVRLINYYGETPNEAESYQISQLRLFRNHRGVLFENKIHERLNIRGVENIINLPIRVYHYGYMPKVITSKSKSRRNIQMLLREMEKSDYNPWIHYHIASELSNIGQLNEALKQLNFGILKFVLSGLKPPSMCYRLKYTLLLKLKHAKEALQTIDKAISIYPDYVDMYYIKGLLFMEEQRYSEAKTIFEFCISLGEDNGNHLSQNGVGSFRAWYYLGICLEKMGKFEEALSAHESSLSISPDFHHAYDA